MPGYDGKLTYLTVKTSEKLNMEHLYFTGFIMLLYITTGHAQTTSLVLNIANSVTAGSSATYNCSSEGTGNDPTIVWSIRSSVDGSVIRSNLQLSSSVVAGAEDSSDGYVKSSVTFTVESSFLSNHRLWCGAVDVGETSPSTQIYTAISATTTTTANLGGSCGGSVTCSTAFASCVSSICRCNNGYYDTNGESNSGGSCSAQASLGGTCQAGNDESCSTANAGCSFTSPYVCVCRSGYVQSGSICVSNSVGLGQSCVSPSRTCYVSHSYCNGSVCVCSTGYYASHTVCVASPAGFGESCTNPTRTCPLNAFCNSGTGTCVCNTGYTYSSSLTYCVSSSAGFGESCTNPTRTCPTNAGCVNGICQCNTGYSYSSFLGYCVGNTAGIGESCTNPTRTCPTNAGCLNSICQCNSGYTYSSSLGYCVTNTAGIGESCTNPTRTCPTNAGCLNSICQCNSGYTYSSSLGYCVTNTAGIGESCTNPTRTCPTNAGCLNSICQCNSGYTYSSSLGNCVTNTAGIGESCTNPTRTCPTNAGCLNSICQCNSGYTYSSSLGYCVTNTAGFGESCTNPTRTCPLNAFCNSGTGTCVCNTGYTYSSSLTYCVSSSAGFGESCTNPTRTCPTNAGCVNSFCQCNSGYTYSSSLGYCVTNTANVGESCVNPSRSCVSNAACTDSTCQCVSDYYALSGACYQKAGLGATCSTAVTNSCSDTHASCTGSTPRCQCNSGYSTVNGVCTITPTSDNCPAGTNVPSTVIGSTSPSTPSVTVGRTCYEVDLYGTMVLECRDSKGTSALQSARWLRSPDYSQVITSTGSFINGDIANPNLTVSNAQSSYAGGYVCQLCYGSGYTQCTNGTSITLIVNGAALTSVSTSVSSTTPLRGSQVTFTCSVQPTGSATSYKWYLGSTQVSSSATYPIAAVGTSQDGVYRCEASNSFNTLTSTTVTVDVQYIPEPSGGTTVVTTGNLNTADIVITCNMNANPAVTNYIFYNEQNAELQSSSSNTYTVTSADGYQVYSCRAQNSVGLSSRQLHDVQEESTPGAGAATENTGIGTGTIAAIVLGIIFFLLLLIIIIVCCCSYGWCRKKEKVEPQVIVEKPMVKPYIPRTIVSASSTVSRKDVGVMMNGHHDVSVSTDFEEPRYTTPRYHLKPAVNAGPIISMFDDGYEQPRAHQLPALDTQYLYPDNEPRRHKKKKRRHRHREDTSPRRQYYEPEPEPERNGETRQGSDEDLVVVPGKQNYFE